MMNPSDALSPPDSAVFNDETVPASSAPALPPHPPELALPPHPPELALPPHPTETDSTPVEDGDLVETPRGTGSDDERTRLSLLAETVGFEKTWRSGGYVIISRRTVEEEVQIPVTLRHEEITMTRHFRDPNAPDDAPDAVAWGEEGTMSHDFGEGYGEGTIVMRLHEEVAEVVKTVRVAEEVELARRLVTEETRLVGTARREELDIKAPQTVHVSGAETHTS